MKKSILILALAFIGLSFNVNAQDSLGLAVANVTQNSAQFIATGYNVPAGGVFVRFNYDTFPNVNGNNTINYFIPAGTNTLSVTVNGLATLTAHNCKVQEMYPTPTIVSPVVTFTTTACTVPSISISADATICAGSNTALSAGGGVSYNWSPATGLSNANIANPVATPNATTDYICTVTDSTGCKAKDTVNVNVLSAPAISASNAIICKGNSANLLASGGVLYNWSPATALSNVNIANPVATPLVTTIYTVSVTDAQQCVGTKAVTVTVNVNNTLVTVTPSMDTACVAVPGNVSIVLSPSNAVLQAGSGVIPSMNIFVPGTAGIGSWTLNAVHTDANGCLANGSHVVTVVAASTVDSIVVTGTNYMVYGNFTSAVTMKAGSVTYYPVVPNTFNLAIFNVPNGVIDNGDLLLIESGGCAATWVFGTGVEELKSEDVKVGPNPFTSILNVDLPNGDYKVSLMDVLGQEIRTLSAKGNFTMEKGNLAEGIYFLQILDHGQSLIKKVIVQ